ncbi:DUF6404 family protein [Inquilinus sp.]|jgi:hypothetical protein|uniref:DUF6404 family protein n=1 Tax=Inquilinus sp. TaxID=1932117 RepID=UPI003784AB30
MDFDGKLERGMALLESKGLMRHGLPLNSLLRRIGIALPPPLFAGFWLNTIVYAVPFGIMFGALTFAFYSDRTLAGLVLQAAVTAILYGLAMAFWTRHVAAKHSLPRWDDL